MRRVALVAPLVALSSFAGEPVGDWVRQIQSANVLVEAGDFSAAEAVYATALKRAETGGNDIAAAVALQNMGGLFNRRGHFLQAEKAYLRAIKALTRSAVSDDRLMVRTSVALTALYIETGRDSKGERLIRGLLADYPAAADSDKASLLGNLGVIVMRQRRFEEAEQILRKTAALCEGSSQSEMQEIRANAIANVAVIQAHFGRTSEAVASYRQALGIFEAVPNPFPVTFVVTLANYAGVLSGTGDRNTAEGLYRNAIGVAKARLGPNHAVLGGLLQEYANFLRDTGRKSEARGLADEARRIRQASDRENLTGHTVEVHALSFTK